jgi:hypothetical protein
VLEADAREAPYAHDRRTREIKEAMGWVCADRAWSTRFETDYGLRWDNARQVWADSSEAGHAHHGARLFDYSRKA